MSIDEQIEAVAASMPLLTPEQRARLAALFHAAQQAKAS